MYLICVIIFTILTKAAALLSISAVYLRVQFILTKEVIPIITFLVIT